MSAWYFVSLFLHIFCAAFWIGGMLFLPIVLLPSIKDEDNRRAILYRTGIRFRLFGWIALGVLLVTGLTNMVLKGFPVTPEFFLSEGIGRYLGYKLLIFIAILLISGVHDFYLGGKAIGEEEGNGNETLRVIARWSGRINLILALLAAFLGILVSRGGF